MKKELIILILLLFNVGNASAFHKDILLNEKYGNVKVFLQTGFKYSEIEKIKIIGELSEKICVKLSFKDTLFIEYVNDYVDIFSEDIYQFENNNTSFKFLYGINKEYKVKKTNNGLSIRINANKIGIKNVLMLVEYSILNRNKLAEKLELTTVLNRFAENDENKNFTINSIPKKLLREIFDGKSLTINEVLEERVDIHQEKYCGIELYWQNNEFVFEYKLYDNPKKILFKTDDYYYCLMIDINNALVFKDKSNFSYIDAGEIDNTKLIYIESGLYRPYSFWGHFENKIILYNSNKDFNIFLTDRREIISKF